MFSASNYAPCSNGQLTEGQAHAEKERKQINKKHPP